MIENFGKNMARLRKEQNMTQIELGKKIGVNKQTISNIEKSIAYPSFNTLEKISNVLNANAIQLFGDERERTLFNATRQLNVLDEYHEKISDALKAEDIIYTIIKNEDFQEKLTVLHEVYTMFNRPISRDEDGIPELDKNNQFIRLPSLYDKIPLKEIEETYKKVKYIEEHSTQKK